LKIASGFLESELFVQFDFFCLQITTHFKMNQVPLPQFDLQLKVLRLFGLWQPENSAKALKIRGFVSHSVFLLITLILPILNYFFFDANVVYVGIVIAFYLGPNLKIPILLFRMKNFVQLFDEMVNLVKKTKSNDRINLRKHAKLMEKVMKFFYVVILGINAMELMNALREQSVPYKSWLPHKHQFVIDHTYPLSMVQVVLVTLAQFVSISLEVLPVSFIGMSSVLMVELSERMERLSDDKTDEENGYEEMKTCVQLHLEITDFVKKIQDQFSTMLFIQGFLSSAYLCVYVLYLSKVRSC
jgi:hypothetical protein